MRRHFTLLLPAQAMAMGPQGQREVPSLTAPPVNPVAGGLGAGQRASPGPLPPAAPVLPSVMEMRRLAHRPAESRAGVHPKKVLDPGGSGRAGDGATPPRSRTLPHRRPRSPPEPPYSLPRSHPQVPAGSPLSCAFLAGADRPVEKRGSPPPGGSPGG